MILFFSLFLHFCILISTSSLNTSAVYKIGAPSFLGLPCNSHTGTIQQIADEFKLAFSTGFSANATGYEKKKVFCGATIPVTVERVSEML